MGNQASSNSDDEEPAPLGKDTLSTAEIRLVKQLWAEARRKGPDEPGRSILSSVFIRSPEIYKMMEMVGTKNPHFQSEMLTTPTLASPKSHSSMTRHQSFDLYYHAKNFTLGLDKVVSNLNDLKFVNEYLIELGRRHALLPLASVLSHRSWDTFGGCMIEKTFEWGSWKQRGAICQTAWGKVVQLIIANMKTGYYNEAKKHYSRVLPATSSSDDHLFAESVSTASLNVPSRSASPSGSIVKSASDMNVATGRRKSPKK